MKHIKKIKIDIDKSNFEVIPSVQYDSNTRFLHINLLNGSVPFNLTGCSVKISGTKADGKAIFNNCTVINAKEGFIEVELTEQMNAVPGTLKCELKLYAGSGVLTTKQFDIEVTKSVTSKEITSSNEFKALTDTLKEVQRFENRIDEIANKGTTTEVLRKTTETYIQEKLDDGTIANLTLADGGVGKEKLDKSFVDFIYGGSLNKTTIHFKGTSIDNGANLYVVCMLDLNPILEKIGSGYFNLKAKANEDTNNINKIFFQVFANNSSDLGSYGGGQIYTSGAIEFENGGEYSDNKCQFNNSYRYVRIVFSAKLNNKNTKTEGCFSDIVLELNGVDLTPYISQCGYIFGGTGNTISYETKEVIEDKNKIARIEHIKELKELIESNQNGAGSDSGTGGTDIGGTGTGNGNAQELSIWKGRKAAFLGDSLTEINQHYTKGYHSWIKDLLGLESYTNFGRSGATIAGMCWKVPEMNGDADLIIVMGGTNDCNFNTPLGTINDEGTNTFYGSMKSLCLALRNKYPKSIIIFVTPHFQNKYPHNEGYTAYHLSKIIKEVCSINFIPVYDFSSFGGVCQQNLGAFTTDGCHGNDKFHEMLGKNLSEFILRNFRYLYSTTQTIVYGNIITSKKSITILEGESDTFTVTLDKPPTNNQSVNLSKDNLNVSLNPSILNFTPSNYNVPQVVTISVSNDEDYANETCNITLSSKNVSNKVITVNITDKDEKPPGVVEVQSISLNKSQHSMGINETIQLTPSFIPSNATNKNVTWETNNSNCKVTGGLVTGMSEGECMIICRTVDGGHTDTCVITIESTMSPSKFDNKRVTLVKSQYASYIHFVALCTRGSNFKSGDKIELILKLSNINGIVSAGGVTIFGDNSGGISNGAYDGVGAGGSVDSSISITKSTIRSTWTINKELNTSYIKLPIKIDVSQFPSSFTLDNINVRCNNKNIEISKIGGFFGSEIINIE